MDPDADMDQLQVLFFNVIASGSGFKLPGALALSLKQKRQRSAEGFDVLGNRSFIPKTNTQT